jgi:hypothetical protein
MQEAKTYIEELIKKKIPLPIAFNAWLLKKDMRPAFMIEQRDTIGHSTVKEYVTIIKTHLPYLDIFLYSCSVKQ